MITAVDSSVLLDVLTDDPKHGPSSLRALGRARDRGRIVACPVVWAEVSAFFPGAKGLEALPAAGVFFDPFDQESAEIAGSMWRKYRRAGGRRVRLLADFLIAAHAQHRAGALISRDRGFARKYFRDLDLVQPD